METVGITGLSGSGKTFLARHLTRLVPSCRRLGTDAYYRDLSGIAEADRMRTNFDDPAALDWDLLVRHLRLLRDGHPVTVPRYDFQTHTRRRTGRLLKPPSLLVLEGVFTLSEPRVRDMLSLGVFVDTSEACCLSRRIGRDRLQRGRTEASVRRQWRRDVLPMYHRHVLPMRSQVDLVVDGRQPADRNAARVLRCLRGAPGGAGRTP